MNIEDFVLELDNDQVPWRLFMPDDSTKEYAVLWIQGWSSSMDSHREGVERMSKRVGMTFATLDPAGHGLHTLPLDESTRKQQFEEVTAVFDELKKRDYEKIIVIGGSFGGYMAALLCGKRPVHAVVLRAPANYPDNEFEMPFKNTKRWSEHSFETVKNEGYNANNDAVSAIKQFPGMVYVLEHELDESVPKIMPQSYFAAAKHGNYLIIPKTEHSPKLMPNPQPHFDYIEHMVISIVEAIRLQAQL